MAKRTNSQYIKLVSTAKKEDGTSTGYYYTTKMNPKKQTAEGGTTKIELKKYDPVVRKHVTFKQAKLKS